MPATQARGAGRARRRSAAMDAMGTVLADRLPGRAPVGVGDVFAGDANSSIRVTSRSTERHPARRSPRARDASGPPASSTSSGGCSPRAPTHGSGPTSPPASRTSARSRCSRSASAASRPRRRLPATAVGRAEPSTRRDAAATGTGLCSSTRAFRAGGCGTGARSSGELAGCDARPVMRIERVAEVGAGPRRLNGGCGRGRRRASRRLRGAEDDRRLPGRPRPGRAACAEPSDRVEGDARCATCC